MQNQDFLIKKKGSISDNVSVFLCILIKIILKRSKQDCRLKCARAELEFMYRKGISKSRYSRMIDLPTAKDM